MVGGASRVSGTAGNVRPLALADLAGTGVTTVADGRRATSADEDAADDGVMVTEDKWVGACP